MNSQYCLKPKPKKLMIMHCNRQILSTPHVALPNPKGFILASFVINVESNESSSCPLHTQKSYSNGYTQSGALLLADECFPANFGKAMFRFNLEVRELWKKKNRLGDMVVQRVFESFHEAEWTNQIIKSMTYTKFGLNQWIMDRVLITMGDIPTSNCIFSAKCHSRLNRSKVWWMFHLQYAWVS